MLKQTGLRFTLPMLPTLVQEPPAGDKWLHEIKHDGFRTQLVLTSAEQRAYTRNGIDWSDRYRLVLSHAERLDCSSAIIDGEIIIQDEQGRSNFDNLSVAIERTPEHLIFYAFDLINLDDEDLRKQTVLERRERLRDLIGPADPECRIQYSEHVIGGGPEFFDVACGAELEGIVSKKVTSRYCSGRSTAWLKTKSFVEAEFVVIGHQQGRGTAPLVLLARETEAGLAYVGTSFVTLSAEQRDVFWRAMERLETSQATAPGLKDREATWVRPELRVRAKHLRCSGKLRHATLSGLL